MSSPEQALIPRPVTSVVAAEAGAALPTYVTREQAHAMIIAARTTTHRVLLKCLWQTGGRVSEVLSLRPCDIDRQESALQLINLKQRRRRNRKKTVYVSPDLVSELLALAHDARVPNDGFLFRSRKSGDEPMTRQHAWRLIRQYARAADVYVPGRNGRLRPATALDFRHGAAVHQLRCAVPLSEVQQQLGHARIDTTTIYTKLTSSERRAFADRVEW